MWIIHCTGLRTMSRTKRERLGVSLQHNEFIGIFVSAEGTEDAVWLCQPESENSFAESGQLLFQHKVIFFDSDIDHYLCPLRALQDVIKAIADDDDLAKVQRAFATFVETAKKHGICSSWLQRILGDVFMTGRISKE